MLLEDIAQVNIGVVLKRKESQYHSNETKKYKVFNAKSYDEKIEYEDFYSDENLNAFIARKNDLLFRMSIPIKIIKVDEEIEGKLINNQYCIIRLLEFNKNEYDVNFLHWFLNNDLAKRQYEKILIGTTIKSIPVIKLRQIELPNININEQIEISRIVYNLFKQKDLYNKLILEKEKYLNVKINEIIRGGEE